MTKIVPILRRTTSCDYHRIILPFKYMGYDVLNQTDIRQADLVVFNRVPHVPIDYFLTIQKQIGFKYIVDVDDYWHLESDHYLFNAFQQSKAAERSVTILKHADAVIATTSLLADKVKDINSNVHVIPNALPFGEDQFTLDETRTNYEVKFVYAGGHSHVNDIKLIADALLMTKCHFTLAGYNPNNMQSVAMKNTLHNNIFVSPEQSLSEYMKVYNGHHTSLVPLLTNTFNQCKSELKVIEAGAKGLAVIASQTLPYFNSLDAPFIDYAATRMEWIKHIQYHILNPSYVQDKSLALAAHVREHYNLHKANTYRKQLFDSILNA